MTQAWWLEHGMEALHLNRWNAVLLDLGLSDSNGLDSLREIKVAGNDVPVIVLTRDVNEDVATTVVHGLVSD